MRRPVLILLLVIATGFTLAIPTVISWDAQSLGGTTPCSEEAMSSLCLANEEGVLASAFCRLQRAIETTRAIRDKRNEPFAKLYEETHRALTSLPGQPFRAEYRSSRTEGLSNWRLRGAVLEGTPLVILDPLQGGGGQGRGSQADPLHG